MCLLINHYLRAIRAVNTFSVTCQLHCPFECLSADVTTLALEREMRATDVIAQSIRSAKFCRTDVADERVAIDSRLLDKRLTEILDGLVIPALTLAHSDDTVSIR
jgi:adenine C2-methylase RlmN of 23S rRNA A2503 and tRNA A37